MSPSQETLSLEEKQRYARHFLLPSVGEEGQKKLKAARVLMIGMGGLGAPISLYLVAAGIGTLGIADADNVDLSNLQRQVLYTTHDVGKPKVEAAQIHLSALNPHVNVISYPEKITAENVIKIIESYDVIVDGTDNFSTHYLINDACVLANKPLVYGNVHRFDGHVATVLPKQGPCYRCLYAEPPPPESAPSCADAGVLGMVPGMVGMMQAMEVTKLILGIGDTLVGRILRIDGLNAAFKEVKLARNHSCAVCGDHPTITKLALMEASCLSVPEITADELKDILKSKRPFVLLDVRHQWEYDTRHIDGARLIPLPILLQHLSELDPAENIVIHCQSGRRSAQATSLLLANGFAKVRNLKGGIEGYKN